MSVLKKINETSSIQYIKKQSYDQFSRRYDCNKIKSLVEVQHNGFIQQTLMPKKMTLSDKIADVVKDYNCKKQNQSIWVTNIKKKLSAKKYLPPENTEAKKKARNFLHKIRDLNLIQLPKLQYFTEMIRKSCIIEPKKDTQNDKIKRTISRLSTIQQQQKQKCSYRRFLHLQQLIRDYPKSPRIRTQY